MKLKIDEKQFLAAVDHEGDHEVGAGKPPDDMRAFSTFANSENVYAAARDEYRKKIAEQALEIDRLRAALREIGELPGELNLSNYTHDDVCILNDAYIKAWDIARAALGDHCASTGKMVEAQEACDE